MVRVKQGKSDSRSLVAMAGRQAGTQGIHSPHPGLQLLPCAGVLFLAGDPSIDFCRVWVSVFST